MDEHELVARTRAGDREAFDQLMTLHQRAAYGFALGWIGAHDRALDLTQEAFARAFVARARLSPERPFRPWLIQILRRLCLNHLRDRRRRGERLSLAGSLLARPEPSDPTRPAEQRELALRCRAAIEALPEAEREALVLREYQQLRYREIAELLSIPTGTVMSRLHSARRRLATLLEGIL